MKNFIALVVIAAIAATAATWFRYQSFDPCVWLEQDYANDSALPRIVIQGRIKAEFLLRGLSAPTPKDCIDAWWNFRLGHPAKPPAVKGT